MSVLLLTVFAFFVSTASVNAVVPTNTGNLPDTTIEEVIVNAINWIVAIIATVAVIIIVIGGVMWVTAGGDEDRAKSSRRWIVAGVGGLIVALGAWAIIRVVTESLFP